MFGLIIVFIFRKKIMKKISIFLVFLLNVSCNSKASTKAESISENKQPIVVKVNSGEEVATFAGGCFWCTEAIFLELKGVKAVKSGYTGGKTKKPSYYDVTSGNTGHAEAIQITFDPKIISYVELLEVFFGTHDPTTLNRQGADVGTQYRSEVFYHSDAQKTAVLKYIALIEKEKLYRDPVVTKVNPAVVFYDAEGYHQNYYNQNSNQGYCRMVISPKLEKLRKYYKSKLK